MNKELVFNIFANTGNYEAYLLYRELNNLENSPFNQTSVSEVKPQQRFEI